MSQSSLAQEWDAITAAVGVDAQRAAYTEWLANYSQKTLDDQRPSWDLIAVYYAIDGLGDYLIEAPNGFLDFDIEKGSRWIQSEKQTNQTILLQKESIEQPFSRYLNRMISLPPRQEQQLSNNPGIP